MNYYENFALHCFKHIQDSLFSFGAVKNLAKGLALVDIFTICFMFQVLVRKSKIWGKEKTRTSNTTNGPLMFLIGVWWHFIFEVTLWYMTLYRTSKFGPLKSKQKTFASPTASLICFWKRTAERKQYCLFLSLDHIRIKFQSHESHAPRWWVKFLVCNDGNDDNWMDLCKAYNTCGLVNYSFLSNKVPRRQWEDSRQKVWKHSRSLFGAIKQKMFLL